MSNGKRTNNKAMREILFKAKRLDNGQWVEGFPHKGYLESKNFNQIGLYIQVYDEESESMSDYEVDPNTVSQYTGLKDKNGVKIFEGDVVEFKANYTRKPGGWQIGRILFDGYSLVFRNANGDYHAKEETDEGPYQWQVTGSIHDKE